MKYYLGIIVSIFSLYANAQYKYPISKTVDSSDTWHNITIKDPYRWMEDLKSDETQTWFKAQNDFTDSLLKKVPLTEELYQDFLKLDSIEPDKIGRVRQIGKEIFYFNIKVGDPKMRLCKRNGELGKEQVIAEYTLWGKNYTISNYEIDPYQKYLAVSAAEGGKERSVTKFYDVSKGVFVSDSLPGLFGGYAPGEGNVYYMQQPTWDVHEMVQDKDRVYKVHKIGTDTLQDKVLLSYQLNPDLYAMDNSKQLYPVWLDTNCNYELLFLSSVSPFAEIYYRKINSNTGWKKFINTSDEISGVTGTGNKLYLTSKKDAPNGKILFMEMDNPDFTKSKIVAPEKDIPLTSINGSKNFLILAYTKNGIQIHHEMLDVRNNTLKKNPFPETTNLMYITPFNLSNDDVHIARTGWVTPITYTYSNIDKPFANEKKFAFRKAPVYPYVNEMKVDEVEIAGHDGVKIPVSIIYRKDTKRDGNNVAFLNSYGAYGISSEAYFSPVTLSLVHKGIMFVVPHVRGGGEKGEYWHWSGYKQSKPNTWKDLNSTAEYLITQGYTSPAHLACQGGSAGGILIGRAVTERPDLWACALPQVGCLSLVRQEFAPNGPVNTPEFGTVKNINEFFAMMEMDATLHVQEGTKYPAMLISTGWNDPRVISWQPAKFAAAVQKANASSQPILLEVDYNGGHGDSEDKFAQYKKAARQMAFMLEQSGYKK